MADDTLAWRSISPGQRVLDRDGEEIGTVTRVLADDTADIFHGVAVRRGLPVIGAEREILAQQIERIDEDTVHTSVDAADLDAGTYSR